MYMFHISHQEQKGANLLLSKVEVAQQFVWKSGKNSKSTISPSDRALQLSLLGRGISHR